MPLATAATYAVALRTQPCEVTQHLGQRRPVQCLSGASHNAFQARPGIELCSGSRRVQRHLKHSCYCLSSKDTQPQLKRQTVKQAIQSSLRVEKPYLLKILLASIAGQVGLHLLAELYHNMLKVETDDAGAATVKFGSLAIDTPFHPSLFTAVGIITLPCLAFSMILWKLPD